MMWAELAAHYDDVDLAEILHAELEGSLPVFKRGHVASERHDGAIVGGSELLQRRLRQVPVGSV
jgi:hypothetical protein